MSGGPRCTAQGVFEAAKRLHWNWKLQFTEQEHRLQMAWLGACVFRALSPAEQFFVHETLLVLCPLYGQSQWYADVFKDCHPSLTSTEYAACVEDEARALLENSLAPALGLDTVAFRLVVNPRSTRSTGTD